jgi:hypothetical protein
MPGPTGIAIDGSGDVWALNVDANQNFVLIELIGAATPVITPISPNNPANTSLTGLAVRP